MKRAVASLVLTGAIAAVAWVITRTGEVEEMAGLRPESGLEASSSDGDSKQSDSVSGIPAEQADEGVAGERVETRGSVVVGEAAINRSASDPTQSRLPSVSRESMDTLVEGPEVSVVSAKVREENAKLDVSDEDEFDFSAIQSLYVLSGDFGYAYAKFPAFLKLRDLIVAKMNIAEEKEVDFTKFMYEVRAVGIGEQTTLYVGDSWIDDGTRSASLSDEELTWVRQAYESRPRQSGMDRNQIEAAIRRALEQQRDPAWQPAP